MQSNIAINFLLFISMETAYWNSWILIEYKMPFYFPTIGQYAGLLEQAGFKVLCMSLFDRMTALKGSNGMEDWIRMFIKQPFEGVPEEEKNSIIRQTVNILKNNLFYDGGWYADYVRIRGKAVKV